MSSLTFTNHERRTSSLINLTNSRILSSRGACSRLALSRRFVPARRSYNNSPAEGADAGDVLTNHQSMDVVRAFVGVDTLEIHEVPDYRIAIRDSNCTEDVTRLARALQRHPHVVSFCQRDLCGTRSAGFEHPRQA